MGAKLITYTAPDIDDDEEGDIEEIAVPAKRLNASVPNFAPYFDVNAPLPGERDPKLKGYIRGLEDTIYHAHPALNSSLLKEATLCEMLYSLQHKEEKTWKAKTLGSILHWAVLEPHKFAAANRDKYLLLCKTDGLDTKTANEQRIENPGKLLVTPDLMEAAHRCMEAIQANPGAMAMLEQPGLVKEVSGFVFDGKNMVWRKIRLDLLPPCRTYIGDVKTTRAKLYDFEREGYKFNYWGQAAYYLDTHFMLTGEWIPFFRWIVVTNEAPFMCRRFFMRNLRPDAPLYEESKLCEARKRLGLDASERIGRIQMFVNAARETEELRDRGVTLSPALMRSTWEGYENESPEIEVF